MVAKAVTIFHHEEHGGSCPPHSSSRPWDPAEDIHCITTTFQYLQTSGWYWGSISASEAREALLTKSEGTFLVRDSSHPQYMLALSVKTRYGPTSVRIEYSRGCFWLDSISPGLAHLQSFPDVLSLIQHYKSSCHTPQQQHLARLTINRHTNCPDQLPLPKLLLHYLQNYPFHI
ncbi:cytokine-inducible SH2-containing protein-like isoform X2 [Echeneis naucrates]|uniref:cytokine-inducible SH2-containing protein-like isoform X2 n=1 Tax=Echeneis naucrates TaxID=173247 RepID=UPI0011141744|nr:cytokine-inducible SH2-containing protein-like isoform X2 [Echeneis naucrates]